MSEDKKRQAKDYLVRAGERGQESPVRHPLNPNSEVYYTALSDRVGMKRVQLALGRLPPGRESFAYHSHMAQEEFVYILSGTGEAEIGEETFEVGPGDYMGFPTDGTAHNLKNIGQEDLVYLMGGERTDLEVAHFPHHGKVLISHPDLLYLIDEKALEKKTLEEWISKSRPAKDQAPRAN